MKDAGRNVVKDDRVRSRLVKRQSFHLSNSQIDPMYCILMYFPVLLENCNSGSSHVRIPFACACVRTWDQQLAM